MSTEDEHSSDSCGRLPQLPVEQLSDAQRTLRDEILHGRRAAGPQHFRIVGDHGELLGPFGPMVLHPALGRPLQALGAGLRYDGSLSARARELVICSVAARCGSEYEWYAHAAVAQSVGVPETVLREVQQVGTPQELSEEERAAYTLAVSISSGEPVTDDVFAEALGYLAAEGVMEVVTLVGYYRLLAQLMDVFQVDRAPIARADV